MNSSIIHIILSPKSVGYEEHQSPAGFFFQITKNINMLSLNKQRCLTNFYQ